MLKRRARRKARLEGGGRERNRNRGSEGRRDVAVGGAVQGGMGEIRRGVKREKIVSYLKNR